MARGVGGSNYRNVYLEVGPDDYIWCPHVVDGVQTGPDPGDFEAALAGKVGHAAPLPAGDSSPADVADLWATAANEIAGVSAFVELAANSDGSWDLVLETALQVGDGAGGWAGRDYASRGPAGYIGGEVERMPETGEMPGFLEIEITRPLANLVPTPDADDRIWAVQIPLGDTISTATNSRPRLTVWQGTTGIPQTRVYDVGQVVAAQMLAGRVASVFLTAAQCRDLRAALDTAGGSADVWIGAHAVSGTRYTGAAVGSGYEGSAVDANIRVDTGSSNVPTASIATWSSGDVGPGIDSFPYLLGGRFVYDRDPCTRLEHHATLGQFAGYAIYPDDVALPDTLTGNYLPTAGHVGRRIRRYGTGVVSGTVRQSLRTGGTPTPTGPSMIGTTTLHEGQVTGPGLVYTDAPTGSSTIRVPATPLMHAFKGDLAVGRGELSSPPGTPSLFAATGRPDQPASTVQLTDADGLRGTNPLELDIGRTAPGYGDASTATESPVTDPNGTEFQPWNNPCVEVETWTPDLAIEILAGASLGLGLALAASADTVVPADASLALGLALAASADVQVAATASLSLGLRITVSSAQPGVPLSGEEIAAPMSDLLASISTTSPGRGIPTRISTSTSAAISHAPAATKGAAVIAGYLSADTAVVVTFHDGQPGEAGTTELGDVSMAAGQLVPLAILALWSTGGRRVWVESAGGVALVGRAVSIEV